MTVRDVEGHSRRVSRPQPAASTAHALLTLPTGGERRGGGHPQRLVRWRQTVADVPEPIDDGARSAAQYDAMAAAYDRHNASSGANQYYERPATIALVGSVAGRRVLEAGCGSGPLTEWLVDAGAEVVAFDVSAEMLALARQRVGNRAEFRVADITRPLAFAADSSFDLVVASLVMHYVRDWTPPLREIHRVLRPSGAVVLSTHHPAWDWRNHTPDDYFAVKHVSEVWVRPHPVSFWRRPLTDIGAAILNAGFVIETLREARPLPELEVVDPDVLSGAPLWSVLSASPASTEATRRLGGCGAG